MVDSEVPLKQWLKMQRTRDLIILAGSSSETQHILLRHFRDDIQMQQKKPILTFYLGYQSAECSSANLERIFRKLDENLKIEIQQTTSGHRIRDAQMA
ncbi:hypothetical protein HDU84_006368, partial [Entophlyctis sp. JEL0112]